MSDFLPMRNAFADHAHVRSDELFAGSRQEHPLLTIAIPTFRRPDLLAEAVRSALAQDFDRPIEVVVVDDDPASKGWERLLSDVPRIAHANFRYLRNAENLRDFGNHSRCLDVARGEWVTILHDDDLLDASFTREMFAQLHANPAVDGLVCRKRTYDCRRTPHSDSYLRRLARKPLNYLSFGLDATRVINARKLFWGCVIGNVVGFICRTDDARIIGGFYNEEYPSADYFFYARFAERFRLREFNKVLVTYRVAVNVSMRKEVNVLALRRSFELQKAYAGSVVPSSWLWLSPLVMARQVKVTSRYWGTNISAREASKQIGIEVYRDRPLLLYVIRALLRGF